MSDTHAKWCVLRQEDGDILLARLRWCKSFWCKSRGLMFRAGLTPDEGLLFVYHRESKLDTSIHMLFMRFPIAVIWLDATGTVVDQVLAKPWRLAYAPRQAAQFFIEGPPALLDRVKIGDRLRFDKTAVVGEG